MLVPYTEDRKASYNQCYEACLCSIQNKLAKKALQLSILVQWFYRTL
jgi:hypothetical protein